MKTCSIFYVLLVFLIVGCKQNANQHREGTNETDSLPIKSTSGTQASDEFNFNQIPVSTAELGDFPYIYAPPGYRQMNEKKKSFEEKYFFYQDSLVRKVKGEYYYASIFQEGGTFEDNNLVNEYKKEIEKLGGVVIYSGSLPDLAFELLNREKPSYLEDMYDARPYQYKQFLIRTADSNIWIELCHALNANQVDLTVVKEVVKQD